MIDITPKYTIIPLSESVYLEDDGLGATIGGLGGTLVTDVEDSVTKTDNAINDDYDIITDLINARLDTSAKTILGDFTFGVSGAIKMITDADNGLWFSPTGILAKKAGVNTLAVTNEGDVTLIGTITASAGSIGGWDISANAVYFDGDTDALSAGMAPADYPFYAGKKYADRASAPFRVTPAGALVATNATISGDITITGGSGIASLSDAGSLAVLDAVGASNCDTTIISGGKIITGLLTASNIQTGTLDANLITVSNLVVGTNVGLGTAEDSAGVTTIIGDTVTTSFVNALSITAGSVSANDITAGTITGSTIQSSSGASRIVLNSGDSIDFYSSGALSGKIESDATGLKVSTGSFMVQNVLYLDTAVINEGGSYAYHYLSTKLKCAGGIEGDLDPASASSFDLGDATNIWDKLYVNSIYAGGTYLELQDTIDMNGNDLRDVDVLYTDEINMLAAPYKIAGSYTSMEFETSASSSGGITITGGSNGTTVSGPLKLGSYLELYSHNGTPGAASSYTGYLYYDTAQTTLVFSNGSGWYKVTATAI